MNTRTHMGLICLIASLAACAPQADEEEAAVLAVIDDFFAAMTARDGEAMAALVLPEGRAFTFDPPAAAGEPPILRTIDVSTLPARFATGEETYIERIWDAEVRIDGPVAQVWAPYDFWRDGVFDHCGHDGFQLLRIEDRWRIANIVWTSRSDDCPESPLGPPQ